MLGRLVGIFAFVAAVDCKGYGVTKEAAEGGDGEAAEAAVPSASPALDAAGSAAPLRPHTPATAAESVEVPAHTFLAGSLPGDEGREPPIEPVLAPLTIPAFSIDALPYPNDPAKPPRTGVGRVEAQALCAGRGRRLCTEVEWEAACKGPDDDLYPTGGGWDATCDREPASCPSGYGVRALGAFREWTASGVAASAGQDEVPALRGGGIGRLGGPRCARRARASDPGGARDLAFRCCGGPMPGVMMPKVVVYPTVKKTTVAVEQVAQWVAAAPQLARLGGELSLFDPGDNPYLRRSKADREDYTLTPLPVLWSPEPGAQLLVVVGRGKEGSFVAAWWPLPDGQYRLASSFVMLGEVAPVALAFRPSERTLAWTTCWKCNGETGHVALRDDHRVVIGPN